MDLLTIKHHIDQLDNENELNELLDFLKAKINQPRDFNNFDIDLFNFIDNNFTQCNFINLYNKNYRNLEDITFTENLIIIRLRDMFNYNLLRSFTESDNEVEWHVSTSDQIALIAKLASTYKDKNFLLLTSLEFIDRELKKFSAIENLHVICVGGDILLEYDNFKKLDLVIEKEINDKHVLCLNNYPRPHRVGTVLYLIYKELDKFCNISFISNELREKLDVHQFEFYDASTCLDWIYFKDWELQAGLEKITHRLKTYNFFKEDVWTDYVDPNSQLHGNFTHKLAKHYKSSLVEIITETTCYEPTLNLTEKYSNSIYGCVFPILISTQGTVDYLRNIGFDTFDDIIDHSYDNEINPFYRLKKAIDLNQKIISNKELALSLWQNNLNRFIDNKSFFENKFYEIIKQKREQELIVYKNSISNNIKL